MTGLEYAASIIGILTFIGGIVAWYRSTIEKQYASQRDWNHLKNNQQQLIQNLDFFLKEQDRRFDHLDQQITEIKGMIYSLLRRRDDD